MQDPDIDEPSAALALDGLMAAMTALLETSLSLSTRQLPPGAESRAAMLERLAGLTEDAALLGRAAVAVNARRPATLLP